VAQGLGRQDIHENPVPVHIHPRPAAPSLVLPDLLPVSASAWVKQPDAPVSSVERPVAHATGVVAFESAHIVAGAGQSLVAIPVRWLRATEGAGAVAWAIEDGTAQPGIDYEVSSSKLIRFNEGQKVRVLYIPIIKNEATTRGPRTFTLRLRRVAGGPSVGPVNRVTVTIEPGSISSGSWARPARQSCLPHGVGRCLAVQRVPGWSLHLFALQI